MQTPRVSVIVMAYNEAATLRATCLELLDALARAQVSFELVIIDDGSNDGTSDLAITLASERPDVRAIHHRPNLGLGGVYRTGFRESKGELVTFFPADGQFPASIVEDFLGRIEDHDLVLGYLPQRDRGVGTLLSFAERVLYRALLGPMPRFQGIMLIRRDLLDRTHLASVGRGWAVVMEFILKAHRSGARIVSAPTPFRPRMHGVSKVNNWRTMMANYQQLWTLRRLMRSANQA